jgi:RNA polymerase sigma factor (sigma-70 family)
MTELAKRLTCVRRMLRVRNRAMGFPLTPVELEDVEQDTIMTVLRRLPSFRPVAPLEAWVHGICSLLLRDAVRCKSKLSARHSTFDEESSEVTCQSDDGHADWSEVEVLLQRMGGVEADVVRLRHFENLTFEEAGRRLRLPTNTAKSHYYRGLTRLRAALAQRRDGR